MIKLWTGYYKIAIWKGKLEKRQKQSLDLEYSLRTPYSRTFASLVLDERRGRRGRGGEERSTQNLWSDLWATCTFAVLDYIEEFGSRAESIVQVNSINVVIRFRYVAQIIMTFAANYVLCPVINASLVCNVLVFELLSLDVMLLTHWWFIEHAF